MSQFWQIPFTKMIQTTPKPPTKTIIFTFTLISLLTFLLLSPQFHVFVNGDNCNNYVQEACNVTHYQLLCVQSLASYSDKARRSPTRWARAGVSVTIAKVKLVSKYLDTINNNNSTHHIIIRGTRNRAALADCVECIQNTLDNAHKSLGVLRRLSIRGFDEQMNDALTWLSAALTDEDTCIRGFEEEKGGKNNSKEIIRLCDKVKNVSYITSNALALVNKLATTGFHGLGGD